jgi:DNA-directed RNA polymerase II subunit RPB11
LCSQLQNQDRVIFAGYKVPHPLEHAFELKVQTDQTTTPVEALQSGVDQLIGDLSLLEERAKVSQWMGI